MIEYITGTVTHIDDSYIVVETFGIGYMIYTPNPFQFQDGEKQTVYTYHHVREDAITLFGFIAREERVVFERLLNVNGIGPKGALAILASADIAGLVRAVQAEDTRYLSSFPGIGKKTAQRIIIDMKDKLTDIVPFSEARSEAAPAISGQTDPEVTGRMDEVKEALHALGYSQAEVERIVPRLLELAADDWSVDQYIRESLRLLSMS